MLIYEMVKTQNNNQPDFGKFFGEQKPTKKRYEIRSGANRRHDLAYLSGYLHDARITLTDVKYSRKRLRIRVNRDCWEIPKKKHPKSVELYVADAELSFSPVIEYYWEFRSDILQEAMKGEELWISSMFFDEDLADKSGHTHFVLSGGVRTWRLIIELESYPEIKFRDLEVPYLWSEKSSD